MDENLNQNTLLDSNAKHEQMIRLMILKLAAAWLEKQEWLNTPYGGQNPVQDLVFQTQLTANRIWEDFFSKRDDNLISAEALNKQIALMGGLMPELRLFFESNLKSKLENNLLLAP